MPTAIFRDEVRRLVHEVGSQLVDVLPREEYEDEHLPKAINIPLKELDRQTIARPNELVGKMARRMQDREATAVLVTTSDGSWWACCTGRTPNTWLACRRETCRQ